MTYYVTFGEDNFSKSVMNTRPEEDLGDEIFEIDDSLVGKQIVRVDGIIREATDEEINARLLKLRINSEKIQMRFRRDIALDESDKLVTIDRWEKYTDDQKSKIVAYRQALRDLPSAEGFPLDVQLPELKL